MKSQQLEQIQKRLTTLSNQRGKTNFRDTPDHARLFDEVYMIARQLSNEVSIDYSDALLPAQLTLIKSQIIAGNRLDAIKSYKAFTGNDLMTSKRMIDKMAENMGKPASPQARILDRFQLQEIENYLKNGQKLLAVKLYKDYTGSSLMDAKRYIDAWENQGKSKQEIFLTGHGRLKALEKVLKIADKPRLRHRQAPKAKKRKKVA